MSVSQKVVNPDEEQLVPPAPPVNKLDLLMLFGELFSVKEKVDELVSLKVDKQGLDLVKNVTDNLPELFNPLSEKINIIVKDQVLNTDDVPVIVNLVTSVINTDIKKIKKVLPNVGEVLLFVKTTLEVLIVKEYLNVENKEKVFQLIDVSFALLTTSIDMKEDCWDFLKKLFKC